jgi:hypothetical protein
MDKGEMKMMWKLSLFILIFAAGNIFAQNTKILTTKIQPVDVQKIVAQKNMARVVAMANEEKLKKVKELLKDKVEPAKLNSLSFFSPVNLTVKDSIVSDKAFLIFDSPETISAYENRAVFSPSDKTAPKLKIAFNAPSAGFYVFDFYIKKGASGNSKTQTLRFVEFFSNITNRNLDNPEYQHQLFVMQVKNTGWNMAYLESEDAVWYFLGVEISQVK